MSPSCSPAFLKECEKIRKKFNEEILPKIKKELEEKKHEEKG